MQPGFVPDLATMRYELTNKAEEDLIDIYVHGYRQFGLEQAEKYHAELIRNFEALAHYPFMGREQNEFSPPVRVHFYQQHAIVYQPIHDTVQIIRILHARQDWKHII